MGRVKKGFGFFIFIFQTTIWRGGNSVDSTKDNAFVARAGGIPVCFELNCNPKQVFDHDFSTSFPL